MRPSSAPWWRRIPWWLSFASGFLASIIGQVLIGTVVEIIGTADVTRGHQAILAAGVFIAAAGTALIGRAIPERPGKLEPWEDFWWGPLTVALSATVLLLSLLGVWIIPEALGAFAPGVPAEHRLIATAVTAGIVLVCFAVALVFVLVVRREARKKEAERSADIAPAAPREASSPRTRLHGPLLVLAFLVGVAVSISARKNPVNRTLEKRG